MSRPLKILIVEDEVITAFHVQNQLKQFGFTTINPVGTGEKAISLAAAEQPDVILMDIRLATKMDGIEAARKILSFSKPIIIFMTGYQDQKFKEEARAMNAVYLIKPIDVSDISEIINQYC